MLPVHGVAACSSSGFPFPAHSAFALRGREEACDRCLCVTYTSEALLLLQNLLIVIILKAVGEKCSKIRERGSRAGLGLMSPFYPSITEQAGGNYRSARSHRCSVHISARMGAAEGPALPCTALCMGHLMCASAQEHWGWRRCPVWDETWARGLHGGRFYASVTAKQMMRNFSLVIVDFHQTRQRAGLEASLEFSSGTGTQTVRLLHC